MPTEIKLNSKIVRETLKAKSYELDEVETGKVTVGTDLRKLLDERLADDKLVVPESGKDKPEVAISNRGELKNDGVLMKSEEDVRTLVERIPEEVLRQTTIRN